MVTTKPNQNPLRNETAHWQALLKGEMRQAAWATVRQIAAVIPAVLPPDSRADQNSTEESPFGPLACRKAEIALFYAYLSTACGEAELAERAYDYLNEAVSDATTQVHSPRLVGGLTEIGWVIAHLARTGFIADATESCAALDELLCDLLSRADRQIPYELCNGVTGFGVYALERGSEGTALAVKVIERLQQYTEHNAQGTTWHTPPDWLPRWLAEQVPQGYYNLGVAHGVPAVIGMLERMCEIDEVAAPAREMLDGAVQWMLSQRSYDEQGAYFPVYLAPGTEPKPTPMAWCYGELSAGVTLLAAARRAQRPDWECETLALLRDTALRRSADKETNEPGICHGTLGNAHLFNRVYQATGDEVFRQAALCWYQRTFDLKTPGQELAGFWVEAWETPTDGTDMLRGVTGIGLALLAAITEVEPLWDRLLVASVPPRLQPLNVERNERETN